MTKVDWQMPAWMEKYSLIIGGPRYGDKHSIERIYNTEISDDVTNLKEPEKMLVENQKLVGKVKVKARVDLLVYLHSKNLI